MLHEACLDDVNELRAAVGRCGLRLGRIDGSGVVGGVSDVLMDGINVDECSEGEDEEGYLAGCELSRRCEFVRWGCIDPIVISGALFVFDSWRILCL